MTEYNAFHITNAKNIVSIVKHGLVPNYGGNSSSVSDKTKGLFFTTFENVDFWLQVFVLEKSEVVILNFKATNEGNRIHENNDFYTNKKIPADEIYVVIGNEFIPIKNYYLQNKEKFDNLAKESIKKEIKKNLLMLRNILASSDKKYTETDCMKTLNLLAEVSALEDRNEFQSFLTDIKDMTLYLLKLNGVNNNVEIYNSIKNLFEKILNNDKEVSIEEIFELKLTISFGFDDNPNRLNNINNSNNKFSNINTTLRR